MSRSAKFYKSPLGQHRPVDLPFHWRNEQGDLPAAVEAYLAWATGAGQLSIAEFSQVRAYLDYYISAACWTCPECSTELDDLRSSVKTLTAPAEISAWLMKCLDLGIDPL